MSNPSTENSAGSVLNHPLSRRSFLKLNALAAGTLIVAEIPLHLIGSTKETALAVKGLWGEAFKKFATWENYTKKMIAIPADPDGMWGDQKVATEYKPASEGTAAVRLAEGIFPENSEQLLNDPNLQPYLTPEVAEKLLFTPPFNQNSRSF